MAEVKRISTSEVTCTVEYEAFIDDESGQFINETISSADLWRIRPITPQSCHLDKDTGISPLLAFPPKPGETVDVLDKDCWWSALVDRVATTREGHKSFDVLIEADGTSMTVSPVQLRLGYVWAEGSFFRRRVTPAVLKKVWVVGETAKIIIQSLLQSPALDIDGKPSALSAEDGSKSKKGKVREEGERRSQRPKSSRLVQVDGFQVLKENLYDLENGEPSVFDRELKSKDTEEEQGLPQPSLASSSSATALSLRPQRALSNKGPAYLFHGSGVYCGQKQSLDKGEEGGDGEGGKSSTRQDHNEGMRKDRAKLEGVRSLYLLRHLQALKPFITSQVAKQLEEKAKSNLPKLSSAAATEGVISQPLEITGQMKEYQLAGLAWLVKCCDHGINSILADEMGLGKTLQTISFLAYLKYNRGVEGPHLVVVPLSVLSNWMAELKRWCPQIRTVRLHASDESERQRLKREVLSNPSSFDVAVTTYDMVNSRHFGDALKTNIVWRYLILDEGHKVKNEETLISQSMRRIQRQGVVLLTGTPIQNNLRELYALLNFLYPDVFTDGSLFDSAFNLVKNTVDDSRLSQAHYLLRPFMLRRVKDEVEVKLPPRMEIRVDCPMTKMQTFWYRSLLLRESAALIDQPGSSSAAAASSSSAQPTQESYKKLMNLLLQLRKCCNHPFMFPDAEVGEEAASMDQLISASGKMDVIHKLLPKLKSKGHRVVLFSQFTRMLDIIEDYLILAGYNYKRLDGKTNRIQRMLDMALFNKKDSDVFIYILCTRAGGLGVNLQTADTCILYDSDWNPQWDLQAMARVHRIGQTKPVIVYRLCTEGTVESRVQRRAEQKLYLDQMVNRGSTGQAEEMEALDRSELLSMLKFGADAILKGEPGKPMSDKQIDSLVSVRDQVNSSGPGDGSTSNSISTLEAVKHSALDFDAEAAPDSTFILEGIDYQKLREMSKKSFEDIAVEWAEANGKRQRKSTTTEVNVKGVGMVSVRLENQYTMQEGGISVNTKRPRSASGGGSAQPSDGAPAAAAVGKKKRKTEEEVHHDSCQLCHDGGDLLCCSFCPVVLHIECLGVKNKKEIERLKRGMYTCPHHRCSICNRSTQGAGGLLFRCEMCPCAFCEDCAPEDMEVLGECDFFVGLGRTHPKQACYIRCSEGCREQRKVQEPYIKEMLEERRKEIEAMTTKE